MSESLDGGQTWLPFPGPPQKAPFMKVAAHDFETGPVWALFYGEEESLHAQYTNDWGRSWKSTGDPAGRTVIDAVPYQDALITTSVIRARGESDRYEFFLIYRKPGCDTDFYCWDFVSSFLYFAKSASITVTHDTPARIVAVRSDNEDTSRISVYAPDFSTETVLTRWGGDVRDRVQASRYNSGHIAMASQGMEAGGCHGIVRSVGSSMNFDCLLAPPEAGMSDSWAFTFVRADGTIAVYSETSQLLYRISGSRTAWEVVGIGPEAGCVPTLLSFSDDQLLFVGQKLWKSHPSGVWTDVTP